jgi:hypothetical protein
MILKYLPNVLLLSGNYKRRADGMWIQIKDLYFVVENINVTHSDGYAAVSSIIGRTLTCPQMAGSGSLPRSERSLAYNSGCSESGGGREADRKADRAAPSRFASPLLRHLCSAVGLSFALVSHLALGVDLGYNTPITHHTALSDRPACFPGLVPPCCPVLALLWPSCFAYLTVLITSLSRCT